jgi:uncharacterized protein YcbK (DUF882 family)
MPKWLSGLAEGLILPALRTFDALKLGRGALARALFAPLLMCLGFASNSTESAIANGETRTITLSNSHTNESGSFPYMVNGVYDSAVLEKLNWFLRDWRHDEKTTMDPKLFDIVWEVYRESGSTEPVDVLSGYRSPETNAMLRRRSRQVAEHSQHMLGKAMDAHFIDVPTAKIRDITMRLQAGGVGFYPTGNTPWVHIDSGSVRYWPRMSHDQIARLFPDGKTVFIPSDGVPLPGYQQAMAEIEARGGAVFAANAEGGPVKSLFAMLFGGGEDDAEEGASSRAGAMIAASLPAGGRGGAGAQSMYSGQVQVASGAPDAIARAKRDLPHGETFMSAPDAAPTAAIASASQKPEVLAALEQPNANDSGAADAPEAKAAQWTAPVPPRRPSEFAVAETAFANAPMPPARPVELASLEMVAPNSSTASPASAVSDASRKNDLIAALLARKLPSVITRGAGGSVPTGALALAEGQGLPEPPERPATLAKAAALSAALPSIGSPRPSTLGLSPLARAALLTAPLPPARPAPRTVLVAARIDRSDYTVMTAAPSKTRDHASASARIVPVVPGAARADALLAMLTPDVEAPATFAALPYGDLRSDAFTGPAVRPLNDATAPNDTADLLRGSSN